MVVAGLILLVAGSVLGLFPLLPVATASGAPMSGVPHLPWASAAIFALGLILLLWQRHRESRRQP